MKVACIIAIIAALASAPAFADPEMVFYVEHKGKVIELFTDLVSPLYDGLGEIIYTAWEADEIATPESSERIGMNMYLIGWQRHDETIRIYFYRDEFIELPASSIQHKIIDRPPSSDSSDPVTVRRPV